MAPGTKPCGDPMPESRLVATRAGATASSGTTGRYVGRWIDHYEDGRFATVVSLEIDGHRWLVDTRDHGWYRFGDRCIRFVSETEDRAELEVGSRAESRRVRLPVAASRQPDGAALRFLGTGMEHDDAGFYDTWIYLEVDGIDLRLDHYDRAWHRVGARCVRVAAAASEHAELDVIDACEMAPARSRDQN